RGMLRTSTTSSISRDLNKSTNSPTERVECPIVKNGCATFSSICRDTSCFNEPLLGRRSSRSLPAPRGFALCLAQSNGSTARAQVRLAPFQLGSVRKCSDCTERHSEEQAAHAEFAPLRDRRT